MIIWSGWGFLVAVVGFGSLFLTEYGVEAAPAAADGHRRSLRQLLRR